MKLKCPKCESDRIHWRQADHSLADATLRYRCAVCGSEFVASEPKKATASGGFGPGGLPILDDMKPIEERRRTTRHSKEGTK